MRALPAQQQRRPNGSVEMLKVVDLFSGIGGFSLGLEAAGAFRTVAFCEQDPFCQAVLRKHWPDVPIYDDVRTIDFEGDIDIITGGYPCQPFSVAGKQKGAADDRHLWPSMFQIIKHKRPRWVVAENVAGHIAMGLDEVLFDLESEGYTARPVVIPACAVDAPHRRDRVWIVADAARELPHGRGEPRRRRRQHSDGSADVADADDARPQGREQRQASGKGAGASRPVAQRREDGGRQGWATEPHVGRLGHGVPTRVDRLKALGKAVVPQVVTQIGKAILAAEQQ